MDNHFDLYCKIFIDTDDDRFQLISFLADHTFGHVDRWNVSNDAMMMTVRKNEDFDPEFRKNQADGYLYARFYVEMEPMNGTDPEMYVKLTAKLLNQLWGAGFKAIAQCEFADRLPKHGGLG